jgi:hypothetical protein
MNAHEKGEFINNLFASMLEAMQRAVPVMPENWDGHEIRRYIADQFDREAWTLHHHDYRRRLRAYRNDVQTIQGL